MQSHTTKKSYGGVPKALHWPTVIFVLVAWLLGLFDDDLPKGSARAGLLVHIFAGLAILVMLAARLLWRTFEAPPPSVVTAFGTWMGAWADPAARIMHYILYALLFAVPVVGIFLQFARGDPLPLFGLGQIPSPWIRDRAFAGSVKDIHELLAHALVSLAVLHAAASLIHHWVFRDGTLVRMLPRKSK